MGVDQTGAALDQGRRAKALPMALTALGRDGEWGLYVRDRSGKPLRATSFAWAQLSDPCTALMEESLRWEATPVLVLVDCVLGLPQSLYEAQAGGLSPRAWLDHLFRSAARFGPPAFGRGSAERFFASILGSQALEMGQGYPTRECERLAGANSVFCARPYQKNVQTGTYRIWRDLGSDVLENWRIAPQDRSIGSPEVGQRWLMEGWPSLLWRKVFGLPHRQPRNLREAAERTYAESGLTLRCDPRAWSFLEASPDHADAAVLALAGPLLQKTESLFPTLRTSSAEGWIAGLASEGEVSLSWAAAK